MKILGIEHVGIAIEDLDEDAPFWRLLLNNCEYVSEVVKEQKVITEIFDTGQGKIELLKAMSPESPIAKFIEKRGKGIHHICLQVEDVKLAIEELIEAEVELIDKTPRVGAEGFLIAFIHPKSTSGVLVELSEKPTRLSNKKV
ncbi:MAG: methylmalonyl-CoA epimerase [Planctomycetia bacterium]|nr:methylmalonyl-CoA epimerase [Planctomycetia bacterium]